MEKIKFDYPHLERDIEQDIVNSKRLACSLYVPTIDNTLKREFFWLDSIEDLRSYLEGKYENYRAVFGKASEDPVCDMAMICMQGISALRSDVFLPGILYNISHAPDKSNYAHLFKSLPEAMSGN